MKHLILILMAILMVGCSDARVKRTSADDPMLRVLIDPTIPVEHYVKIRRALVQSGKFEVVDRRDGFAAAVREQDMQFRSAYSDRFSDREKWAHIGRMYGAVGIITAHAECYQEKDFWGTFNRTCKQDLAFINGTTGVVEFEVEGKNSEPWTVEWTVPDWNDVVEKAVDTYPEFFKPRAMDSQLVDYMDQSEEHAKRERERGAPAPRLTSDQQMTPQLRAALLKMKTADDESDTQE